MMNRVEQNAWREFIEAANDALSAMEIEGSRVGFGAFRNSIYEPAKGDFASQYNLRLARLKAATKIAESLMQTQETPRG